VWEAERYERTEAQVGYQSASDPVPGVRRLPQRNRSGMWLVASAPPAPRLATEPRVHTRVRAGNERNQADRPSNSLTMARSSFNSFTLASILARLNSFNLRSGTILQDRPSERTGKEQISPGSIP
jgi:hypothetical protein